jgi:apolipoprotein D and lipocalin family protein
LLFFRRVSRVIRDLVRVVPGPRALALLPALLLTACLGMPEGVQPVENFEAQRYLGRWYEIARLDHSFERDLVNVTAEYSRREDGAVVVRNRGFDSEDGEWDDIEGVARFVEGENLAYLKVSFFGPFYGSYVVFDLDREAEDYGYAFVSGFNRDYLWLLSREPTVPDSVKADFLRQAESLGFPVGELIWVPQESAAPE